MSDRERAHSLMSYYMRMIAESAGISWTADNEAEVAQLVNCLIDAAKEEMNDAAK